MLSVTGSNLEVANINPFRYRSYYYDNETGMYYLQSRYYDPEICRFINCDDVNYIGVTESEISYNPFAYCGNKPVGDSDPNGNVAVSAIIGALFGVAFSVLGFFLSIIIDNFSLLKQSTKKIGDFFKKKIKAHKTEFIIDVIFGAISGALSTTNKHKIISSAIDIIQSLYNSAKDGLSITQTVISLILDLTISNLINTSQSFSKFNFKKVRNESKHIIKNLKKLTKTKIKVITKIITNQIMYYLKSNKTLYKKFVLKYSLQNAISWVKSLAV